jgi:lipoprotein-releasing system ATP-binding protein
MILQTKDIHKSYDGLHVLKGINLTIQEGEVVSIVGSSGAGKTTLLQILGTLDKPDEGILEIAGERPFEISVKKIAEFRNRNIGFIFQFHQLLPEFTAIENILLPAMIHKTPMDQAKKEANRLIELVGLTSRSSHKPNELSGGEQQRIAVCRALINQPKVIFADEPSGNLDSKNSEELHNLFFKLREEFNQTFVIVTHNEILADMADRKLVMQDGIFLNA